MEIISLAIYKIISAIFFAFFMLGIFGVIIFSVILIGEAIEKKFNIKLH